MKFVVPHAVSQTPDSTRLRRLIDILPFHERPLSRPSATLSPPCGERAGRGEALTEPNPGPSAGGEYMFSVLAAPVAQTCSLLYRRFLTCQPPTASNVLPIANRRYGRLKICATLNRYGGEPLADSPGRCSFPLLGGARGTGIELSELRQDRSADFTPLSALLSGPEGSGLKSVLLNSMAVGVRGGFHLAHRHNHRIAKLGTRNAERRSGLHLAHRHSHRISSIP